MNRQELLSLSAKAETFKKYVRDPLERFVLAEVR